MSNYNELQPGELCIEYVGSDWLEWRITHRTHYCVLETELVLTQSAKNRLTLSKEALENLIPPTNHNEQKTWIDKLLGIK